MVDDRTCRYVSAFTIVGDAVPKVRTLASWTLTGRGVIIVLVYVNRKCTWSDVLHMRLMQSDTVNNITIVL